MKEQLLKFWNDEEGVTTLEYAILAALLVAGLGVVITALTGGLADFFETISAKLQTIGGTTPTPAP
ncbi:Flp family type IVb pilin [Bordetella petrii]|uniref:Flp family type IVb pilin n=1 Tax=Bordetella petrii TaxID=94624 RepID=UPI001E4851E8|nr:Flp family type IVb pilin [Bordetella petrii]MCD0505528.1 Flp family type IVb pilin [Bordetella petrii]